MFRKTKTVEKKDNELINQILFNNTLEDMDDKSVKELIKNDPAKINNNYNLSHKDKNLIKDLRYASNFNQTNNVFKLIHYLPAGFYIQLASYSLILFMLAIATILIIVKSLIFGIIAMICLIWIILFSNLSKKVFNNLKSLKNHDLTQFHLYYRENNPNSQNYERNKLLEEARKNYNHKGGFYINQYAVCIYKTVEKGKENIGVDLVEYIPLVLGYKTNTLESQTFSEYKKANEYKLNLETKIKNLEQKALENSVENLDKQIELKEQKLLTESKKEDLLLNNLDTDSAIALLKKH